MKIKGLKSNIFIIFIFGLISLYATFPLILHFKSSFYGYRIDPLSSIWHFWWLKCAWFKGVAYDFVPILNYPTGTEQYAMYPIWDIFNRCLSVLFGEVATYNFQIVISFFLAGVAMYYLIYYFTKNKLVSFFSGLIFTLSPYHFARSWDHLSLSNLHWVILYILSLFILDDKRTYKAAIICSLCFVMIGHFSNYYYVYFMVILTVLFIFFRIGYNGFKKIKTTSEDKWKIIKLIMVWLIIVAPITLSQIGYFTKPAITGSPEAKEKNYARPFHQLFSDSARPLNYFLPTIDHPLLGKITKPLLGTMFYGKSREQSLYLGYAPLILAFIGYRRWRKRKQKSKSSPRDDFLISFFIFAFFAFMITSFSPYWGKAGNFFIPFPSYFLYKIFPMYRNYARVGMLVMFSVSVLAGFGLREIMQETTRRRKRAAIFCLVTGLVLFEFLNIPPYKTTDISKTPPVYEWLEGQPGNFAIAEYPLDGDIRGYEFYQRIHQKSLINGAVAGTPAYEFQKKIMKLSDRNTPRALKYLGAKYVILHLDTYAHSDAAEILGEIPDLTQVAGLELVKKFDDAAVYRINFDKIGSGIINKNIDTNQKKVKLKENTVPANDIQLETGENLTFSIKYMWIIPIGVLNMQIKEITWLGGREMYHLVGEVRTSRFLSFFFKAETNFDSYVDRRNLSARLYKESILIRGQAPKEKTVIYNQEDQTIEFRGIKKRSSSNPHDPFSIIYYIRIQELLIGKKFNFNVEASKRNNQIEAEVMAKESVNTEEGKINAWVVRAILKTGENLAPLATVTFWLSDDEKRVPLFIKAKTPGGFLSLTYLGKYKQDTGHKNRD